jgi:hypothetical protein
VVSRASRPPFGRCVPDLTIACRIEDLIVTKTQIFLSALIRRSEVTS